MYSMNPKDKTIRILLADDHQMMREGLKNMLDEQPGLEVVAECLTAARPEESWTS